MKEYICACCNHKFTLMAWEPRACPECRTAFVDKADEKIKNETNAESVERAMNGLIGDGIISRGFEAVKLSSGQEAVMQSLAAGQMKADYEKHLIRPGWSMPDKKIPVLDRRSGCAPEDAPVIGCVDNIREEGGKTIADIYVDPAKLGEDRSVFDIRSPVGRSTEGFWAQPMGVVEPKPFIQADLNTAMIEMEKATRESEQKGWDTYRNMLFADLGLNAPQVEGYMGYIRACMDRGVDLVGKVVCLTMPVGEIILCLDQAGIRLPDDHKLKKQLRLNAAKSVGHGMAGIIGQSRKPYLYDLQEERRLEKEGKIQNPIPMVNGTLLILDEATVEDIVNSAVASGELYGVPLVVEPESTVEEIAEFEKDQQKCLEETGMRFESYESYKKRLAKFKTDEQQRHQKILDCAKGYNVGVDVAAEIVADGERASQQIDKDFGFPEPGHAYTPNLSASVFRVNRYTKLNLSPEEEAKLEASRSSEMPLGDPRVLGLWPKSDVERYFKSVGVETKVDLDEVRKAAGLDRPEAPDEPITDYYSSEGSSDPDLKRGPSEPMKAAMTKTLNEMVVDYFDRNISRMILGREETGDSALKKFFSGPIRRDPVVASILQAWKHGAFPSFEGCLLEIILQQYEELKRLRTEALKYYESLPPKPIKGKT